ncbi:MAG TPA: hypothetical protein EYN11_05975, partial [Phycisphaerales bacterium]|nr:hypothetical protein [Phycisphaerales bacterium]
MDYSEDSCNCPICEEINDRNSEVHCKHFLTAINVDDANLWGKAYYLDASWEALEGLFDEIVFFIGDYLECKEDEGVQKVFNVFSGGDSASEIWIHLGAVIEWDEGIIYGSGISWSKSTYCFHEDPTTAFKQLGELYSKVIEFLKVDTKEKLLALV